MCVMHLFSFEQGERHLHEMSLVHKHAGYETWISEHGKKPR